MSKILRLFTAFTMSVLLGLPAISQAQVTTRDAAKAAKLTPDLFAVRLNNTTAAQAPVNGLQRVNRFMTLGNSIAIDAVAAPGQDGQALLQALQALGLQKGIAFKQRVFGYMPIDKLGDLQGVRQLQFARPSYRPMHKAGLVTSQGDKAMRADVARQTYGVTGAGTKVGVLSDSYNALGGAPAGVASGDLPPDVQVIDDYLTPDATDEGRAMAEIVHDIAPGAAIAFNTAYNGEPGFAKGIIDLANAGCKVITDDITYFFEPFFQDGIVAQAVEEVATTKNVSYFSSAGNDGRSSYQSKYVPGTLIRTVGYPHDFGGGDYYQSITLPPGETVTIILQWNDPFYSVSGGAGAQTDMDLLVYYKGELIPELSSMANNLGDDPVEGTQFQNTGKTPLTVELALVKRAGPDPGFIKWINFDNAGGDITIEHDTQSSTTAGHANSQHGAAVGAARYDATPAFKPSLTAPVIEYFSSAGGTPIFFTPDGQRLSQSEGVIREQPQVTAIDGGNTTFFGFDYESDGFPNFFGTSAAAPHAAGVAALMQDKAANALTPSTVLSIMKQTALDMNDPATPGFDTGFDFGTGYGLIQADKALKAVLTAPGALTVTSFVCNYTNSVLTSVDFVVGYANGTFAPALPPLFINGVTDMGVLGQSYHFPFDQNVSTLTVADQATRAPYFTWDFRAACANGPTPPAPTAPVAPMLASVTATVGTPFSYVVPAFTGTTPIVYAASGLPAGLMFDAGSRTISGTPTTPVVATVTVSASNVAGQTSGQFTITVSASATQPTGPTALTITSFTCFSTNGALSSVNFVVGYTNGTFTPPVPDLFINGVTITGQLGQTYTFPFDANTGPLPIQDQATRSTYFVWDYRAACSAGSTPPAPPAPPTGPATLTITSFNCNYTNSVLSDVNFVVGYTDGTFAPALPPLFINGVTDMGVLGQSYHFPFDQNVSTLTVADQATRAPYFTWNFRAACGMNSTRIGAVEPETTLRVSVVGNPVVGQFAEVDILGAAGESLDLQVIDAQGRSVSQHTVRQAGAVEHQSLRLGRSAGIYFIQAATPTQSKTVKVIRQ